MIDTWFRGGDWANQWLSLRHVFAIFESIGNDEVAATIYGALDPSCSHAGAAARARSPPATSSQAVDRLTSRLGADLFAEAAATGRNMRDEASRPLHPRRNHRRDRLTTTSI